MKPNPRIFYQFREGGYRSWNYVTNDQYTLLPSYMQRLWEHTQAESGVEIPSGMDEELKEAGFLLEEKAFEEASKEWTWGPIAEIYHLSTSALDASSTELTTEEWIHDYLSQCENVVEAGALPSLSIEGERVDLPHPDESLLQGDFLSALKKRKTTRHFSGKPISLVELSTLLYFSLGPVHAEWSDLESNGLATFGRRKTFPSGGGLHPEEAYVFVRNVSGLEPGLYHYESEKHYLTRISDQANEDELINLVIGQYFAEGIAAGIWLTSRFDKSWWKYPHPRAYRVALLDCGHASQTVLLTSTALKIDTWITGFFQDELTRKTLGLTDREEYPLFFIGLGHSSGQSVHPKMIELAHERKMKKVEESK